MNTQGKNNYRTAFRLALLLNLLLLAIFAVWWWRSQKQMPERPAAGLSNETSSGSQAAAATSPAHSADTPLVPVQLTPQRMQSIGVKLGTAQVKAVAAELRVTGTVEADERRIAYVQTRF